MSQHHIDSIRVQCEQFGDCKEKCSSMTFLQDFCRRLGLGGKDIVCEPLDRDVKVFLIPK